ncbi:MAG: hypothetical protein ACR2LC_11260 [Pyrinomonadaceae bacterium]
MMTGKKETSVAAAAQAAEHARLNYFDYFTEIEDAFIRRRGKHLLLSPMDWALMQSWKELGVPLHVALRGIEGAFDSYEAKPRRRSVKSLLYCQEEVEAQFAEWRESQLGAATQISGDDVTDDKASESNDARLPFPRAAIQEHLARTIKELSDVCAMQKQKSENEFSEALARAVSRLKELETDFAQSARPDAEKLEASLTSLEELIDKALPASLAHADFAAAQSETETQLRPYHSRMEEATYKQTFDNLLLKRLREQQHVPRLSLFYL